MGKRLLNIYGKSPILLQNILVNLYSLKMYRREYGGKFLKKLREFENLEFREVSLLEDYQNSRLRDLIYHCYHNVPFYREVMDGRKLKPEDIVEFKDLCKLPVLKKEDVRKKAKFLVANNFKSNQLIPGNTSGSTGSPLQFYWDKQTCLIKNVVDWRQKRHAGISPGDKMAVVLGRIVVPVVQTHPPFWRHDLLFNRLFFSNFHLSIDNMAAYLKKFKGFGPAALEAYPSSAYILARFLLSRNEIFPLKAVFTSSETLHPEQRESIEKAFACKIFDSYGLAERTIFATECEKHEGHHINMDFGITEILNDKNEPVDQGHIGRVVATSLHNYAMPLIRYDTGDITAMKRGPCSCGRHSPLIDDITTKAEDIVTTADGRYIPPVAMTHPFKPLTDIIESQIIQEDLNHIRIKIVRGPGYSDHTTSVLLDEFKKRLGADMNIDVEFVESITRTAAGKLRWVISKVPLKIAM